MVSPGVGPYEADPPEGPTVAVAIVVGLMVSIPEGTEGGRVLSPKIIWAPAGIVNLLPITTIPSANKVVSPLRAFDSSMSLPTVANANPSTGSMIHSHDSVDTPASKSSTIFKTNNGLLYM